MTVQLHEERGRQWARDCGIEFVPAGAVNGDRWKYLDAATECDVCGDSIPAGRLVWSGHEVAHIACKPATRSSEGLGYGECGKLDRALRGTRHETTPKAAAKYLSKLDPRTCPRFTVKPADAVTSRDELRPLAWEVMMYAQRAELVVAGGQTPAASKVAKPPRVAKPVKVAPVAAPAITVDVRPVAYCSVCRNYGRWVELDTDGGCPTCADIAAADPAPAHPVDVPGELPGCVAAWLERLVYGPKAEYARAWAEHVFCGADEPADPGAEWAGKARRRMEYVLAG